MSNRGNIHAHLGLDPEVAHARPGHDQDAVIGRVTPMLSNGAAPSIAVQSTQLISARVRGGQWVMTLMPATTVGQGALPWFASFDGGATAPTAATFSAPVLPNGPVGAGRIGALQCVLGWGAGGAKWETRFDYPAAGATFGLCADRVDLNVQLRFASSLYTTPGAVPVVGAFMVPGIAANPIPLWWMEAIRDVASAGPVYFAVKPYARKLKLVAPGASANDVWLVSWEDGAAGHTLSEDVVIADAAGMHAIIDVPSQATSVEIDNGGAAPQALFAQWQIGLT